MEISNTYTLSNVYKITKNTNPQNIEQFKSSIENKSPEEISYEEYKHMSKKDLEELFPNNKEFEKANILRMTATSNTDESLGKILFNHQISQSEIKVDKYVLNDINRSMFSIKFIEMGIQYGETLEDKISEDTKQNPNLKPKEVLENISIGNKENLQKEYDYILENKKVTPEEYFSYINNHMKFIRKLIQDEKDGVRIGNPSDYEKHINEIEKVHNKIKIEYEKQISDNKSIETYHKLANSINPLNKVV